MFLRNVGKTGFLLLLLAVAGPLFAGGIAWAGHDCCGHPYADGDSGTQKAADDDCVCACCQGATAISPLTDISFRLATWWPVETAATFAVSRFETDIFRPPLA